MSDNVVIENAFQSAVRAALGSAMQGLACTRGEWTLHVKAADYYDSMAKLKVAPGLKFDQLIDLCGIDYQEYAGAQVQSSRFGIVVHLLSVELNQRLRVRVLADDDGFPCLASVSTIWSAAAWCEREAFDLFGVMFDGHNDLRRILTDYGFVGHPFRKDFPITGHVEMRYDAERQRVVYEPVSIEPRENTPRIVREENYGGLH